VDGPKFAETSWLRFSTDVAEPHRDGVPARHGGKAAVADPKAVLERQVLLPVADVIDVDLTQRLRINTRSPPVWMQSCTAFRPVKMRLIWR
jgi:hypothetical protein